MGLMDGPLEPKGQLGLTGLAGLLQSLRGAREFETKYDESSRKIFPHHHARTTEVFLG
jgi:hypothetical protein